MGMGWKDAQVKEREVGLNPAKEGRLGVETPDSGVSFGKAVRCIEDAERETPRLGVSTRNAIQ